MILADAGAPIAELAITTLRRLDFSAVVDAVTVAAVEYAVADADAEGFANDGQASAFPRPARARKNASSPSSAAPKAIFTL